jgi:hypothetical protein
MHPTVLRPWRYRTSPGTGVANIREPVVKAIPFEWLRDPSDDMAGHPNRNGSTLSGAGEPPGRSVPASPHLYAHICSPHEGRQHAISHCVIDTTSRPFLGSQARSSGHRSSLLHVGMDRRYCWSHDPRDRVLHCDLRGMDRHILVCPCSLCYLGHRSRGGEQGARRRAKVVGSRLEAIQGTRTQATAMKSRPPMLSISHWRRMSAPMPACRFAATTNARPSITKLIAPSDAGRPEPFPTMSELAWSDGFTPSP